jgi:hypothetical protein
VLVLVLVSRAVPASRPSAFVSTCAATVGEAGGSAGVPTPVSAEVVAGTAVRTSEVAGVPGNSEPHWLQKRASGGLPVPQTGHVRGSTSGWPHWMQNRAMFGLLVPQLGQIMRTPGTL